MPARDGTGPLGRGSRTGRGIGSCSPGNTETSRYVGNETVRPYGLGRRFWDGTFGRLLRRRRINRSNRK